MDDRRRTEIVARRPSSIVYFQSSKHLGSTEIYVVIQQGQDQRRLSLSKPSESITWETVVRNQNRTSILIKSLPYEPPQETPP